nr:unnamed protein product [Digitaria exilis]
MEQSLASVQAFVAEHMTSKDLDMDWSKEAVGLNGFRYVGCNDLRDIALNSLRMFFTTAVQMLSSEAFVHMIGYGNGQSEGHALRQCNICEGRENTTWVPKGREEELALKLVQRLGELKLEVKAWTDWANERVMQSTNRLVNERTVLLSLKKDKTDDEVPDVFNKKKLEETQRALDSTSDELDRVTSRVQELTDKITHSRHEKKAVQLQAKQADESFANLLSKETEFMDRLKSMETEKILLQEELVAGKSKLSNLLKNLEQARRSEDIVKKRCQEGEKMLNALEKQVNFERTELERIDTSARAKSSKLLLKAQKDQEWLQANIRNLKEQVDEMSSGSKLQMVAKFMTPPGFMIDSVQREQECAMCLEEEVSVVFLPCGHQVVCAGCNQRHRDGGLTECPSCRAPIKRRICARFADS